MPVMVDFMLVQARCIEPPIEPPCAGSPAGDFRNLGFKLCRALGATPRRCLEQRFDIRAYEPLRRMCGNLVLHRGLFGVDRSTSRSRHNMSMG